MMETSRCRICLAENMRILSIMNTKLQYVYDRLSQYPLKSESNPIDVCYICYARLKKAHELMIRCCKSQESLTQMLNGTQDQNLLTMSPIVHVNIMDVDIKDEILCQADIDDDQESLNLEENRNELLADTNDWDIDGSNSEILVPPTDEDNNEIELKVELEEYDETRPHLDSLEGTLFHSNQAPVENDMPTGISTRSRTKKLNYVNSNNIQLVETTNNRNKTRENISIVKKRKLNLQKKHVDKVNKIKTMTWGSKIVERHLLCHLCGVTYTNNRSLNDHIRIHTGERPYRCNKCVKCFSSSKLLRSHLISHRNETPYSCDICSATFKVRSHIKNHKRRIHNIDRKCMKEKLKPFYCDICPKKYGVKRELILHIRSHTGEKPYQCDTCSRKFSHRSTLIWHIRNHTGEKPFKCNICQKSFASCSSHRVHMRRHTGEKRYQCDLCAKRFIQSHHLTNHLMTHTGEKPYKCDICHKCFNQAGNLRTHQRLHNKVAT